MFIYKSLCNCLNPVLCLADQALNILLLLSLSPSLNVFFFWCGISLFKSLVENRGKDLNFLLFRYFYIFTFMKK